MRHILPLILLFPIVAQGQFGLRRDISISASAPSSIVVADLDGDGMNDVLVAAYSNSQVAWYKGLGFGLFGPQQVVSMDLLNASSCDAADLDGDGDLDLVAVGATADKVVWYRNDGAGNFGAERVLSTTADGPWGVQAVDLDGDGMPEVIAACGDGDRFTMYRNLGSGQFGSEEIITQLTDGARMSATGDLDGDGDIDLVTASAEDNKVAWYANQGDGDFGSQVIISSTATWAADVFVVDLDGDDDLDVLSASQTSNRIEWFANDGNGGFTPQPIIANTASVLRAIFPADFDGDGDIDVCFATSSDGQIAWYANNGSGQFGALQFIATTGNPLLVVAGDVDNDGDMDVLSSGATSDRLELYANSGVGQFGSGFLIATSETSNARMSILEDIDGDGDIDVMVVSNGDGKLSWYANQGDGSVGPQNIIATESGLNYAILADADGDGDLDAFSIHQASGGYGLSLNNGTGQFGPRQMVAYVPLMYSMASGDLDGDGDIDLAYGLVDSDGIKVAYNNGDGTFVVPDVSILTASGRDILLADVDGDNDLDLIIADPWDDLYYWHPNDGAGNFADPLTIGPLTASTVNEMYWEDMNGDGNKDLVSSTDDNDRIAWVPNLGNGIFGPEQFGVTVNGPRGSAIMDMDGDGDLDIAVTSWFIDGGVYYSLNNGSGVFSTPYRFDASPYGPIHLQAADLDGDGDKDLVLSSNLDDRVSWYENYFGSAYRIHGSSYHDLNANSMRDVDEPGVAWVPVTSTPLITFPLSEPNGDFTFYTDSGSYEVSALVENSIWQVGNVPNTFQVELTADEPQVSGLEFGIVATVDTSLIIPNYSAASGVCEADVQHWITMANHGSRIEHGAVTLDLDPLLTFNSATPEPDLIEGDRYTWNFDALTYEEIRSITLDLTRPSFVYIGDTLHNTVQVLRMDGNELVTDTFTYAWSEVIVCAYDPNDKLVDPKGFGSVGYVDHTTDHLDYTIRFQNTGNAPAQDVVLRDVLDPSVDPRSLTLLGYSHQPSAIHVESGQEMVIRFDGIQLPDSSADRLGSQGYVNFRLDLRPGLNAGTCIENQALIFFDLNPPVVTNTVVNTLRNCDLFNVEVMELDDELVASIGNRFQWYFNGVAIPDATGSSHTPELQGDYTVTAMNEEGCNRTSEPYTWIIQSIGERTVHSCSVVPNPTNGHATLVNSTAFTPDHKVDLLDMNGRRISVLQISGGKRIDFNTDDLAPGLYLIRVMDESSNIELVRFCKM